MKHKALLGLVLTVSIALPLKAQFTSSWENVCRVAGDHEITVQTVDGNSYVVYCLRIDVDEMTVTTKDHQVVKIARSALARIDRWSTREKHQLSAWAHGLRGVLHYEFKNLLTTAGPVMSAAIPVTVAYGAAALPFCALGDLTHSKRGEAQEIRVVKHPQFPPLAKPVPEPHERY